MAKGLGASVSRKDLARAIAKNVPLSQRGKAFGIAKEFGIKGAKFSSGKISATEAKKVVQALKEKSLFKSELGARNETSKTVLTKLVAKQDEGPAEMTGEERAKMIAEKRAAGGRRFLGERLREEDKAQGRMVDRIRQEPGKSVAGASKPEAKQDRPAMEPVHTVTNVPAHERPATDVVPAEAGTQNGPGLDSPPKAENDTTPEEPKTVIPAPKSASEWEEETSEAPASKSEPPAMPI